MMSAIYKQILIFEEGTIYARVHHDCFNQKPMEYSELHYL